MKTMRGRKRAALVLGVMLAGLLAAIPPAHAGQICFNNMADYVARASVEWQGGSWSSGSLSLGQTKCATVPGTQPVAYAVEFWDFTWKHLCKGSVWVASTHTVNLKGLIQAWCEEY